MASHITFTIVEHADPPKFQVWQHLHRWLRPTVSNEVNSFETIVEAEACVQRLAEPWKNVFYYDRYGRRDTSW